MAAQGKSLALRPPSPTHTASNQSANGSEPHISGVSTPLSHSQRSSSHDGSSTGFLDKDRRDVHAGLFSTDAQQPKDPSKAQDGPSRLRRFFTLRNIIIITIPLMILIILLATLLTLLPRRAHGQEEDGPPPPPANGETIHLSYGSYKGVDMENGVTSWMGMRYARPPTGQLRWAAPESPERFEGVQDANRPMRGCVGVGPGSRSTEDCLGIDVFAPTNITANSSLPVYLYIQGGGLNAATGHANATGLIQASNNNIVVASISYRTGIFGFLASKELQDSSTSALNNGLRDQRQAMRWVQEHISHFGGDPKRVTIGGQSAGAGCIASHLTVKGGDTEGLFHAALMQSQSMPSIRTIEASQYQFDNLAQRVGCGDSQDKIACMRDVPYGTLIRNARADPFPDGAGGKPVFAYNTVVDGELIREVPMSAYNDGRYARVPVMLGDVTNEGTIFTRQNATTVQAGRDFLMDTFPRLNTTSLDRISELYGFNTLSGRDLWESVAQVYGDIRYTCPGVEISNLITSQGFADVWNFRYNVRSPNRRFVGHGSDLGPLWSNRNTQSGQRAAYAGVVPSFQGYWISFITTHSPDTTKIEGSPEWVRWNATDGERMRFDLESREMEFLTSTEKQRCGYLATIHTWLEQ